MTTAVIIQARVRSTRLPAKTLLPLPSGRLVLEEVVDRCKQIKGVDVVVVAIPDSSDPFERVLQGVALKSGAVVVVGPENDVLGRYAKAAHEVNADVVVRITSDCPLLDSDTCSQMLVAFKEKRLRYLSNAWPVREVPHGWDCEIFSYDMLYSANTHAEDAYDRQHVTPYMQREVQAHGGFMIWKSMPDRARVRWTLDTIDDYAAILKEFYMRSGGIAA